MLELALKIAQSNTLHGPGTCVSSNCIENKQCCGAVGVCPWGEVQRRGRVPASMGSLAAASSATSSCPILESQCLPILAAAPGQVAQSLLCDTRGQDPGWGWGWSCPWNSLGHV